MSGYAYRDDSSGEAFMVMGPVVKPTGNDRVDIFPIRWLTGPEANKVAYMTVYALGEYASPTDDTTTSGDDWLDRLSE